MMFVAVVCSALVTMEAFDIWFSYREQKSLLIRVQREQAKAAAASIGQFVKEIQGQMAWATFLSWDHSTFEDWRLDAVRLLRQVPAVTEVAQLSGSGHELFRISRQAMDVVASHADHSHDAFFIQAMANKVYYGPVYFVNGSEPYMTLAMAGLQPENGVIVAQVISSLFGMSYHKSKSVRVDTHTLLTIRGALLPTPILASCCAKPICHNCRRCRSQE